MKTQVPENPVKNRKESELFTVIVCVLTTLYLTANLMAVRVIQVGGFSLFDAGTIVFPFTYMLGDAVAELWGFQKAKKVILLTTFCNLILVAFTALGCVLPYPDYQADTVVAYNTIFGFVPRILLASIGAFLGGELLNAFVLVKLKEKLGEQRLWLRCITSSLAGHAFDTVVFVLLAFVGVSPWQELVSMIVIQYVLKVLVEASTGTPLVYALVNWLKQKETPTH